MAQSYEIIGIPLIHRILLKSVILMEIMQNLWKWLVLGDLDPSENVDIP